MDINKHIAFSKNLSPAIMPFLLDAGIPYDGRDDEDIVGFDILVSHPRWSELSRLLENQSVVVHSEQIFNEAELNSAEWMIVRSTWHRGWSEPANDFPYKHFTFSGENACLKCKHGLVQIGPYRTKSAPKWGKRHFLSLIDATNDLFLSNAAKGILENSNINGAEFCEVLNKNGIQAHENFNQLYIPKSLPEGFVPDETENCYTIICPNCGKKRYRLSGEKKETYRKEIFENAPDIVKTGDAFGGGKTCYYKIIIRQNVYQAIIANKLDRGLMFYPIDLV